MTQSPAPQQPSPVPQGGPVYGSTRTPPPRRSGGTLLVVTLVVSVLALVVALAGVGLAALALGRSSDATDLAAKNSNQVLPATTAPTAGPTTETATTDPASPTDTATGADPSTTPTDISPTAQFAVAYEGQHLTVRSPGCNYSSQTHVDLDEPRVVGQSEDKTEIGYSDCSPGALSTTLPFAEVSSSAATPKDCLENIRTDPGRSPVAPAKGMTLCFVTDQNAAAAQGISQKLVFVTVDSIAVDNNSGVLSLTAKAWTVPQ